MNHLIAGCCLVLGAYHISSTVLFLSPSSPLKAAVPSYFYQYIPKFFSQDWHLFSPDPSIVTKKLLVRCSDKDKKWSPWFDPMTRLLEKAYSNPIGPYGKLVYVYSNIPASLWRVADAKCEGATGISIKECRVRSEALVGLPEHTLAVRFANQLCQQGLAHVSNVQFKLVEIFPFPYSQRRLMSHRPFWKAEELVFPSFPAFEGS